MVDTSERKGRGKGKSKGVQKGKGKANGKREEEEASDSEIETEAAVEASALELEDSTSRPPLQLPLRSPSQEKSQTLAHEVIPSTIVPPATLMSFHNSTLEAFRVLQAFMANTHTYPSAELWEPWLSCITSIEPDDEESFQSVRWELDAEISQRERVESTEEKVNQKNPEGNEDQAQAGGPGDAPERNLQKQSVNTTKDASPEASLPEDNEVKSLCADAMLREACQVLGSFCDDLEDAVMRHCKQSFNFKEFDVWKLARACVPSEYQLAYQAALVEWHDIAEGELARCLKGNTEKSDSDSEGSGGGASEDSEEDEQDEKKHHNNKHCNKMAPIARVKAVNLFSQFIEEEEFEEEDNKEEEGEDEKEKDSAYKEGIKEIAAKAGVDMDACFTYLNQQLHRTINRFNAFKAHDAEHETIKKSLTQSLSNYNKFLREEYWRMLELRLSDSEIQDLKARSWVMKPEVDWYREQAQNLYETSGYHMLGWLINTSTDKFGHC
ncbi:hypothetical protein DFJ43DRAFT_1042012 [Lentinula guzmanii]|uniref:Uncharacterized protein n=1 Tax=Lentinula guzmanii TaxID=2804957 RepID=A0AA38J5G8_9AGAR|nr:hypothetical protein DFJ43DRAFT_1042012 [Lentinula guzmanii]